MSGCALSEEKNVRDDTAACFGFLADDYEEMKIIDTIGMTWVRPHPGPFAWEWIEPKKGIYNFDNTDAWVHAAQENNLEIIGTIWPFASWDQETCHEEIDCMVSSGDIFYPKKMFSRNNGIPAQRCAPCNEDAYVTFVTKLVERYDGDGIDDMEGLTQPVKVWEILNEPEMQNEGLTFFKGSKEEYMKIVVISHGAIKDACTDCKIALGGIAGNNQQSINYWKQLFDDSIEDYADIITIHFIKYGDLNTLNIEPIRKNLSIHKEIWITEAEYLTEDQLMASLEGAFSAGASKIFFTQFDIPNYRPGSGGAYSAVYNSIGEYCVNYMVT